MKLESKTPVEAHVPAPKRHHEVECREGTVLGKIGRQVATVMIGFLAPAVALTLMAEPSNATAQSSVQGASSVSAAATYSTGSVCFRFASTGGAYNYPTYLQVFLNGSWQDLLTASDYNGCRKWPLIAGYSYRVQARTSVGTYGRTTWLGTSGYITVTRASTNHTFGTVYVSSTRY